MPRRLLQLILACIVLGLGVALLLDARLGSDGYSTLLNGLVLVSGWSFLLISLVVGVALLSMAWALGRPPGVGTVVQTVLVGATVNVVLPLLPAPESLPVRGLESVLGILVLGVGVAGYLAVDLGAGPAEAAAQSWERWVPFRWGYTALQASGMLVGWLCGADVGISTLLIVLVLGWLVDRVQPRLTPAHLRQGPLEQQPPELETFPSA
ncbi:hypothetical protein MWU75_07590 [Ornithinimicrobium sp. F0845]|uniref:YczE/YyaS/YitT family protein n=1 Tax=Ornithinimicrobium sp. F0845 TaxID=2926412 RepID=UPI001FF0F56F|nr:hypothetical protein [Ornithinimicrobium sp. F0845]MCK0111995.1 hypothetical protein [Ornithinimicrobium sp. F0845]